ncbi:MAG: SCP-like extracellular [Leptolyngbyaceae cyanobacterium RM2_2_4]|nr:SCP-like extracellular [Leptolyngbyaceae cyanobacterium SM1_4_3]NJN91944.1 SCP-like extracellular [Leptolyngbyaceae cyanobacterium SL_5_14]NJO51719.1 SCP-like extracellular [Leptolyngbyaceae cyanobacterium RM2_2_4]NJO66930.1 SCP-like extracellular [Leptolyngbyaceae cyanobacterium RM1_405_57]
MAEEILEAHNKYRAEVNVAPLTWSNTLASNAQEWANHLASLGGNTLQHSSNTGEGENLWLGTSGAFSYTQMVDMWGTEKQYFINGTFPDVSSTGNWFDVGHYTQIVWGNTTEVGCAIATSGGNDILVCRYSPPGNYSGQPVF